MNVSFSGQIESDDVEVIVAGLHAWLGSDALDVKVKLAGERVKFEDTRVQLTCYRSYTAHGSGPKFLIEGTVWDDLEPALQFLAALRSIFAAKSVAAELDYSEVDADGEPTGDDLPVP